MKECVKRALRCAEPVGSPGQYDCWRCSRTVKTRRIHQNDIGIIANRKPRGFKIRRVRARPKSLTRVFVVILSGLGNKLQRSKPQGREAYQ